MEIDFGHIILVIVACTVFYRWLRTRHLLYRITEKTDALLLAHGLCAPNLFKSPKMRRLLTLHKLAIRLEERIDRLLAFKVEIEHDNQQVDGTRP